MSTQTKYLLAYNRFCLYFYKMFFTKLQKSGKRLMKMDKAAFLSATPQLVTPVKVPAFWMSVGCQTWDHLLSLCQTVFLFLITL